MIYAICLMLVLVIVLDIVDIKRRRRRRKEQILSESWRAKLFQGGKGVKL